MKQDVDGCIFVYAVNDKKSFQLVIRNKIIYLIYVDLFYINKIIIYFVLSGKNIKETAL